MPQTEAKLSPHHTQRLAQTPYRPMLRLKDLILSYHFVRPNCQSLRR